MKLNYKRTFFVGLAFMSICAFWQVYDNVIPLILKDTFHVRDSYIGIVMAMDNVLALFMLPLFGKLSDKTRTKIGRRMPYILGGTILALLCLAIMPAAQKQNNALLFFIGLFVVVSGLEDTGCLDVLAGWISRISGGHAAVMVAIILWLSAVCSAFVDNIPFSATMVPVIQSMSRSQGVDLSLLAWALSIGTDLGGSATPIGASANVVGTSVAAKNGHPVTWGTYCKYCAPATVLVITIAMVCLFLRYL